MLIVRHHGPDARAALWVAVDDAKASDALAPVTVAAPSPFASLSLRRLLATRPGHLGLVNVRFLPLARIAELLGAPTLAATGRRPLTPALRMEAVRAVLADRPGPFGRAASHPATERSLSITFAELRRAGPPAVTALTRRAGLPVAIADLYHDFRDRTARFYDDEDLALAAAGAPLDGSATDELGVIVLYLPTRLTDGEAALIETIARSGRLRVVLGLTGDAEADALVREQERRLAPLLGAPAPPAPASHPPAELAATIATTIVSAPDPEDEVREVLRLVLARSRAGTPLHRIAVLYRLADPYARIAADVFDGAEVPWAGPSTRHLADGVAARVLMGLLDLADADFARDSVSAWLASGPVLDPADGHPVPSSRWDLVSREAGIVGGLVQWDERLARFVHERRANLAEARVDDETSDGTIARLESDVEHAEGLRRFVADLGERVRPPEPATWPAMTAWARGLLDTYLGGEGRRRRWPEVELETARTTVVALERLDVLAEIRPHVGLSVFRRALEAELDAPAQRIGHYGTGVFVGPLRAAYATDFDVVFVVGMAEGAFPPRGAEDPLLPDRDRAAAGGLPLHTERRAEERRDYLAAIASGGELVLSFPRADPRAQRKRLPARWLLDTAGVLAGATLGAQELTELSDAPWYRVVPSFEAGLCGRGEAGALTERDVRSLRAWPAPARLDRHPLVAGTPELAAGVAATRDRRSRRATGFDGLVGAVDGLLPPPGGAVSATALEEWATCPFRYLLSRVLRVREVARPEETQTISPLARGSLMHAVLEEFLRVVEPRTSPTQPWTADERMRLIEIAVQHCARAEDEGLTGRPLLWQIERRRLLRGLAGVLDTDERFRAELGVVPSPGGQEVEFGRAGPGPLAVALPDGRTVGFRGRIDRVDHSPDGSRAVVYDYKTGRGSGYADDALDDLERGVRLQLPVYGLAARRDLPNAEVDAYYWFVELDDDRRGFDLDTALEPFQVVLGRILDGVGSGVFPAYPGEPRQDGQGRDTWVNCCYCPYDRVCPPARDDVWDRKADDPAVVVFRDLAEPMIAEPMVEESAE